MKSSILIRLGLALVLAGFATNAYAAERQVPASAADVQLSFAPIVKRVAPTVVNVYASRTVQQSVSPFFSDPFFRQFFGGQFGGQPSTRVQRSLGSGVIISADGLIVTNFHVIAQADEVKVALSDKREFSADIVLKDERSDLAVLKIAGNPGALPVIEFADSDQVEVGDLALAIGDPFGVGQTVTSGIVSAFARVPGSPSADQYFIQTDAAINPGNSGGALVDMQGRLIGINRMIVSPSGASSGIGFAIPSNLVHTVTQAAATGSAPKRPWLGAELQNLTPELAASLNIETPNGVLVASVAANGPAAAAGMKVGDLVTSIDGEPIDDLGALTYRLATHGLGGEAKLGVVREQKKYTATVALSAAPETPPRDKRLLSGRTALAGLTVFNLSPAVADELSYDGEATGVIVGDVASGSNAEEAGFRRGDVIAQINGTAMETTKQVADTVAAGGRYFDLTVRRAGQSIRLRMPG